MGWAEPHSRFPPRISSRVSLNDSLGGLDSFCVSALILLFMKITLWKNEWKLILWTDLNTCYILLYFKVFCLFLILNKLGWAEPHSRFPPRISSRISLNDSLGELKSFCWDELLKKWHFCLSSLILLSMKITLWKNEWKLIIQL